MEIKGSLCHQLLIDNNKPSLSFNENVDFESWKSQVKSKAVELLGINEIAKNACPPNLTVEEEVEIIGKIIEGDK
jgi:hypothetical protein